MKFVLFTLSSSAEYVAIFILMFTLFRFRFKGYRKQIALTSIILCYVSYTMRLDGMENITSIVQFILLFMLVWILFQVQPFYAAIMSFTAFFGYGLIQGFIVLLYIKMGFLKMSEINYDTYKGYVLASSTVLIASAIGWLIRKNNKGFDFVPTSAHGKMKYTKLNLVFISFIVISTLVMSFIFYITNNLKSAEDYVIFVTILVASVSMLLYLAKKKDWENV
jgi:hypothetical protein